MEQYMDNSPAFIGVTLEQYMEHLKKVEEENGHITRND